VSLFSNLYEKTLQLSQHQHAPRYLSGLSFAESSFFPIPPDVMLAPMALANREKAWHYAFLTTIFSVLGGILGYGIGVFAFDFILPWIEKLGYLHRYEVTQAWFQEWGVLAIFIAGFSPIPYKVFTIAAGVISMSFLPFILASFVGRGGRFYLVAGMMVWGGDKLQSRLKQYVDIIGWGMVGLIALFVIYKML
jgi:membrane protein YqaA with SNARE-associated domain